MKKIFVISLFMIILLLSESYSATWDNAKGIGLSFSGIKPKGGNTDQGGVGMMYGGNIKYGPTPYTMLSLDAGYGSFQPLKEGSPYEPDENSPFETTVLPVNLSLRLTPYAESSLKPYFLFGVGMLLWDLKDNDTSVHGQKTDFGMALGLGVEWFVTQCLGLDLLLRSSNYPTLDVDNVGFGDANHEMLEGRITLSYYWGQNRDRDKDGILDKVDAAPLDPEDFDGFQDHDGAPDLDNDNDGIPDVDDGAPNDPEDKDGFQDEDGIPDPDNDNDGIPDTSDKCPNESETINGYQDEDGCPDKKPMPALEKAGAALVLKGVNFKTGSAELTPESAAILDEAAEGLKAFPEVDIEIRGYTDDVGRAAANQTLSEARAKSVRQYLIDKGIAANRLTAVGYGEENPVASNTTPEGRAQNRRIEFYRTK